MKWGRFINCRVFLVLDIKILILILNIYIYIYIYISPLLCAKLKNCEIENSIKKKNNI